MPIKARARTLRAVERDAAILDAGIAETRVAGLDQLGMHGVARRVGLSAGAVYSRHETVGELMVALWQHRCAEPTLGVLRSVMDSARHGSAIDRMVLDAGPELVVGLEMVAVGHRYPELAEVVVPEVVDVVGWTECDDLVRSRAAFLLGLTLGTVIRNSVDPVPVEHWESAYRLIESAIRTDGPDLPGPWVPLHGREVRSETGDALRDALVNAACDVIGRVGLVAATNTRISRRAGLTPGAVYTMYDSKDELLIDAMRTLLGDAVNDNLAVTVHATDRSRMGEVSAHLLSRGGGGARRPWLRFRLEAYIAAMHRRDLAEVLSELHSEGVRRYEAMLGGVRLPEIIVALVALVGQSMPLGLSVLDRHFDGLESIDYRPVTMPLLNSLAAFTLD